MPLLNPQIFSNYHFNWTSLIQFFKKKRPLSGDKFLSLLGCVCCCCCCRLSAGLLRQATYTTTRMGIYSILFERFSGYELVKCFSCTEYCFFSPEVKIAKKCSYILLQERWEASQLLRQSCYRNVCWGCRSVRGDAGGSSAHQNDGRWQVRVVHTVQNRLRITELNKCAGHCKNWHRIRFQSMWISINTKGTCFVTVPIFLISDSYSPLNLVTVNRAPAWYIARVVDNCRLPADQRRGYTNVFNALFRIMKEEGVLTLWRVSNEAQF